MNGGPARSLSPVQSGAAVGRTDVRIPRLRRPKAATLVEVPGWCPKHHSAVGSSATVRRSRAPRGRRRRMHGKGPCGQKASRAVQALSFHRGGRGCGLGGSRATWLRSPIGWRSRNGRRLAPPRRRSREATETSEVRSHCRRGKKMPTPAGRIPAGHAPMSIRRSGLGGVNHPFPRVNRPASQESSRTRAPQGA